MPVGVYMLSMFCLQEPYDVGYYVGYFALLCCLAIVAGTVAIITLELTCLRAAKHLHAHMLRGLLSAPAR